jgi:Cytochrome c peroxidase
VALQPAFFHNGAYTRLDEAIRFHLNVVGSARRYNPALAGLPGDLTHRTGPPIPKTLIDPRLRIRSCWPIRSFATCCISSSRACWIHGSSVRTCAA